ncbi:MAG TPA: hypothetical protein VF601_12655 [Beijerinckiaceae bacterium]|jgi:hypothetical protein
MIERFKTFGSWLQAFVAAVALSFNDYLQTLFKNSGIEKWYLIVLIVLTIVGMKIADLGANLLLKYIKTARQLLAGKDDIEGEWVDVGYDFQNNPKFVSFCVIEFNDGQYAMSGESWTTDGSWVQEFSSVSSNYTQRELKYNYRTGLNSAGGYSNNIFLPHDTLPREYVGRFIDDNNKIGYIVRGTRISRKFRRLPSEKRRQLAIQFLKQCKKDKLPGFKI